jgi:hypothetical protein
MQHSLGFKSWLALACLVGAFTQNASALEVSGVKFEDTVRVGNKELKLNGAGMRVKAAFFKLYVAGLYLPEKKSLPAEVLALGGPKRITIVMQREISSEDFGDAFMKGVNENSDKAEKSKFVNQTVAAGEMFATIPSFKKGDTFHLDWVPGVGTQMMLNGKQFGANLPDVAFYNAVLKIWIGEKPVDSSLKPQLLGETSAK